MVFLFFTKAVFLLFRENAQNTAAQRSEEVIIIQQWAGAGDLLNMCRRRLIYMSEEKAKEGFERLVQITQTSVKVNISCHVELFLFWWCYIYFHQKQTIVMYFHKTLKKETIWIISYVKKVICFNNHFCVWITSVK